MRRDNLVLLGCLFGISLAALEGTVVGTVMPSIVAELGGRALYNWVFSVYMLAAAVTMPIWGKLADLHGAKRYFVAGVLLFLLGSILSGTSPTVQHLIAYRIVQGLGAGALFSLPMTILGRQTAPERRGHMLGFAAGTWGVAGLLGPPIGTLITATLSWRWIFYLNIPFGLLALYLVLRHYTDTGPTRRHKVDVAGALLIASVTLAVLLGTQAWREGGPLFGVQPIAWTAAAVLLLPILLLVERRVREPILPLSLFGNQVYRVANAGSFLMAFCVFSAIVYMPMMTTIHNPDNVIRAGLSLIPASLGWTTGALVGGRLVARVGARNLGVFGATLGTLGFAAASQLGPTAPLWLIMPIMFPIGLGIGSTSPALLVTLQNHLGQHHMGVVTSGVAFYRHLGGTLGITLLGALIPIGLGTPALVAGVQHVFMTAAVLQAAAIVVMLRLPKSIFPAPEDTTRLAEVAELGVTVGADLTAPSKTAR